jgi:hypothetical protein
MQCKEISSLMMKHFDGNISELELEQLLRHNQKCPACAEEFEVLKSAIFEIEMLPDIDPPAELTTNIMAAVASQKHFSFNSRQLVCWIMGFVGLVLFTYNIISYALFPAMGLAPIVSIDSGLELLYRVADSIKEATLALPIYFGKLLIIRDMLLREYTLFIILWVFAFVAVGLMLYKVMNMKSKTDIERYN